MRIQDDTEKERENASGIVYAKKKSMKKKNQRFYGTESWTKRRMVDIQEGTAIGMLCKIWVNWQRKTVFLVIWQISNLRLKKQIILTDDVC